MYSIIDFPLKKCKVCNRDLLVSVFGMYYCDNITCPYPKIYKTLK